ncbi:hypothetical protein QOU69_28560, partial [Burkholderia pseudomallei]
EIGVPIYHRARPAGDCYGCVVATPVSSVGCARVKNGGIAEQGFLLFEEQGGFPEPQIPRCCLITANFGSSSGDIFGHLKGRLIKIAAPRPALKLSRPLVEALGRTPIFTTHLPNQSTQARNTKSSSNWTCIDLSIR